MPTSPLVVSRELDLFADVQKEVAWKYNALLYELRIQLRSDGWLAIIKAAKGTDYRVAFVGGSTFPNLLRQVGIAAESRGLVWKQDDYIPKHAPSQLEFDF